MHTPCACLSQEAVPLWCTALELVLEQQVWELRVWVIAAGWLPVRGRPARGRARCPQATRQHAQGPHARGPRLQVLRGVLALGHGGRARLVVGAVLPLYQPGPPRGRGGAGHRRVALREVCVAVKLRDRHHVGAACDAPRAACQAAAASCFTAPGCSYVVHVTRTGMAHAGGTQRARGVSVGMHCARATGARTP
jgi:hypothetical protein